MQKATKMFNIMSFNCRIYNRYKYNPFRKTTNGFSNLLFKYVHTNAITGN